MGGNHILYFNFFTIGALIPVVFHFLITVFFLSIPEKSRATFHLCVAFFLITLFNFAYVISPILDQCPSARRKTDHLDGYIRSLKDFEASRDAVLNSAVIRSYLGDPDFYVDYYRTLQYTVK